jgi:hypothetical protein
MIQLRDCRFHLREQDGLFLGVGAVEIGGRQVRSGRLPWLPYSQTFDGLETCRFRVAGVHQDTDRAVLTLAVEARRCAVALRRDRNIDPLIDTADWVAGDACEPAGVFRLVLRSVTQQVGDLALTGFSYAWEYDGPLRLHAILDRCTWELDGDIAGATVCSQTGWIDPVARFTDEAPWTSELGHELQAWPRWAVMQGFDFQAKADGVLCGMFERVGLIRSILRRERGGHELKVLDRHVGDSGLTSTVPKRILLAQGRFDDLGWQNAWSDLLDDSNRRARAEFGLREVPAEPYLQQDFWTPHTFDDYRRDLLPAAAAIGVSNINVGNVNRNAATEGTRGNQCCSHAYEPAPGLGGTEGLRRLVADARAIGLRLRSWTSTAQGFDSPLLAAHRNDSDWFLRMEDGGTTFGSVHMVEFHCLNLAHAPARRAWLDALLKIRAETGLDAWFLDMFANVSFMPLSYAHGRVTTIWRACLEALAGLQGFGIDCDGGSPTFVRPLPGGHAGYERPENLFINHRLYMQPPARDRLWTPQELRSCIAHGSAPALDLFYAKARIDSQWTPEHRRELDLFAHLRPFMQRRRLVPGGVDWLDSQGRTSLSFACAQRDLGSTGPLRDALGGAQHNVGLLQAGEVVLHVRDEGP